MRRRLRLLSTGVAVVAFTATALADDPREELRAVEQDLQAEEARARALGTEVGALEAELADLRQTLIDTAARVQGHENELMLLSRDVESLSATLAEKEAAWYAQRTELAATLAALIRLRRTPPTAAGLMPGDWRDLHRTLFALGHATPALESQVRAVADEMNELARVRASIDGMRTEAVNTQAALQADREQLEALLMRKSSLYATRRIDQRALDERRQALAAEAEDLRALVAALREAMEPDAVAMPEADLGGVPDQGPEPELALAVPEPPAAPPITAALPSSLPFPAHGVIVSRYGDGEPESLTRLGIILETGAGAQVVAPLSGRVVFAGPFRSYGLLLILEHGQEYHTLLSGFARIDSVAGQSVERGEPVGVMAEGSGQPPRLYIEIREHGQPINPVSWLTSDHQRVNG